MTVKLKNNAIGYLASAISASDVTASLTAGNGASFPTLGAGEYFYATITATSGVFEVVKVTARATDSLSIVRAQESTSALAFAAGALVELRVTAQAVTDAISDQIDTLETDYFAAAGTGTAVGLNIGSGKTLNATSGTVLLPAVTVPAQTTDGSVAWDSDNELLTVGTGSARKTMVDTDSTQTLTNKTLTSPVISSITNTGTITLPTSTDTLVGRSTTDTLANKTLTSPTITSPTISGSGTATLASITTTGNVSVGGTLAVTSTSTFTGTATHNGATVLAAGTASLAPLQFVAGTNMTTPTAGVKGYDGTIFTATPDTNFKRGVIPVTNYASGTGTALGTNTESTLSVLLPSGNTTITLAVGTYYLDTLFIITRGASSTTSATARLNILGSGTAVGTFSGMSLSAPTSGGTTNNFSFDAVNVNTTNVLTAASTTAAGVYQLAVRGILKITTAGSITPQYSLSANINAAGTVAKVFHFILQQLDSQSAAAAGPSGNGWS